MSESEEAQARRFHFAADRKRYAITRGLVRTTLSRYAPVAPSDWTFTANLYGRPAVAESHKAAAGLIFNISHTLGMIVLAVTRNLELGVDVENTVSRHVSIGIAERFFAPTEVAALARVPHHQRQARFFEYWTFKESYIKARGMGLSIPLDRFSFHYPHERGVLLAIEPELRDDPERWCLWQLRPTRQHVLALCATRHPRGIPDLTIRRVLPAVQEELLDPPIYRTSEIDPALVPALARLA
jgi:4'-phosphopantetheinyl transferase